MQSATSQRLVLASCVTFVLASSLASALYVGERNALIVPFIVPAAAGHYLGIAHAGLWSMIIGWSIILGLTVTAWRLCRPFLTWSVTIALIVLVVGAFAVVVYAPLGEGG